MTDQAPTDPATNTTNPCIWWSSTLPRLHQEQRCQATLLSVVLTLRNEIQEFNAGAGDDCSAQGEQLILTAFPKP